MITQQPIDIKAFQNTIHEWITEATKLEAIWQGQSDVKPLYPFAALSISSGPTELTHSWQVTNTFNASRAQGREIQEKKVVDCNITVECQFYVKMPNSQLLAISYAAIAISELQGNEQQARFQTANIAVRSIPSPQRILEIRSNTDINRAVLSIVFGAVMTRKDYVGYFDKVQIINEEWETDQTITLP